MTTLAFTDRTNVARFRPAVDLVHLRDQLWRVTRAGGDVLGYIEGFDESGTARYRAKRLIGVARRVAPVGEFWTLDEAADCFG